MKQLLRMMGCAIVGAGLLCGCEGDWTTGGGAESWSARYNWVNFSGTYRGVGGGVLVTDYSATPAAPGRTNRFDRLVGQTQAEVTRYSGVAHSKIVPGSVQILVAGMSFTDPAGDGSLSGSGLHRGTVDYGTGAWNVELISAVPAGQPIRMNYLYVIEGTQGSGAAGVGTTRVIIYSFVVEHTGNKLRITDNTGAVYEGNFGDIRTTGGVSQDTAGIGPEIGDQVIAQYEVRGVSAAGYRVTMVGTFQGTVGGASTHMLMNRKMFGTWIEEGGRTGDINGEAAPIAITTDTSETAGGETDATP